MGDSESLGRLKARMDVRSRIDSGISSSCAEIVPGLSVVSRTAISGLDIGVAGKDAGGADVPAPDADAWGVEMGAFASNDSVDSGVSATAATAMTDGSGMSKCGDISGS